jgi:hypothetical protein
MFDKGPGLSFRQAYVATTIPLVVKKLMRPESHRGAFWEATLADGGY